MKKSILFIIHLLLTASVAFSQEKINDRLSISFSAGPAIPIGAFANTSIEQAQLFLENDPTVFIGIDKSKAGFAQIGLNYRIQLDYLLNPKIFTFLRLGRSSNSVDTAVLEDFFTNRFKGEIRFEHDDYQLSTVQTGVGYRLTKGYWNLGFGILVGYGRMNYPYYQAELLFSTNNPKLVYSHSPLDEQPYLGSLVYGGLATITYQKKRFKFGLDTSLEKASFEYQMRNGVPGTTYWPFQDIVKTALLNTGLSIGYSF
jgi:hypothetical protein